MTRGWLFTLALPSALLFLPGVAQAQPDPPGCPPGEWFCDDVGDDAGPPEGDEAGAEVEVEADEPGIAASPDRLIDVARPAPPPAPDRSWSEGSGGRVSPWALALRVQGVVLDSNRRGDAARLGGVGLSGRYALNPTVTLDLGADSILGTDYNGNERSELSLSFSSLFFLNRHPVVRTYVLVGLNASRARVDVRGDAQTWGYLGGHTGLGLDITLDPRVALNFDVVAFMRGRTDSRAAREPEFTDGTGRVTNTSGGGLLRGGVTLHF